MRRRALIIIYILAMRLNMHEVVSDCHREILLFVRLLKHTVTLLYTDYTRRPVGEVSKWITPSQQ